MTFERVVLIFNPHSTGDAEQKAAQLRDELASRVPALPVELLPTERAGHARELARHEVIEVAADTPVAVEMAAGALAELR